VVTAARWDRITAAFAAQAEAEVDAEMHHPGDGAKGPSLCDVVRAVLDVTAVAITLMTAEHRGRLGAAGKVAAEVDDLQFLLGVGPSIDAYNTGKAVSAPWLKDAADRWPALISPAVAVGAAGVFALPLRVGAARLGALTLYQAVPGPLSAEQCADAPLVAEMVMLRVLAAQANMGDGDVAASLVETVLGRAQVHQASGMTSAQLGVGIVEALVLLRTHAFTAGRPLADVADDVVARRLRLERAQ
jgi:hypothetical protein